MDRNPSADRAVASGARVPMLLGKAEAARRLLLGVELDQYRRLIADHPRVVTGLEHDHARSGVLETAAVGVLAVNAPAREEAYVRMHAEIGADRGLEVSRPSKAARIHD